MTPLAAAGSSTARRLSEGSDLGAVLVSAILNFVIVAAVLYFLEVDDAWSDVTAGGLSDDARVVRAAELTLDGR